MRSLGPASHCSLDAASSDQDLTLTSSINSNANANTNNTNNSGPPRTTLKTSNSHSKPSITTTTTTITSSRPPITLKPALHPQQPQQQRAPRARSSIRSSSGSLQPPAVRSPSAASFTADRAKKRTSLSPQPAAWGNSASSRRSASSSSAATSSGRSVSATLSSATSSTTASAARSRHSLEPTDTTSEVRGRRERRSSGFSNTSTTAGPQPVPRPPSAALLATLVAPPARPHNGTLHTPAPAGLVKQPPTVVSRKTNMPIDRQGQGSAPARPTMPTLSASVMRSSNRAPMLPKVATKGHQGPSLAPSAVTTPVTKRFSQTKPAIIQHADTDSHNSEQTASYLASHITPRSGTRQVRVDSASTTPNGTPNLERYDGWDPMSGHSAHSASMEQPNFRKSNASLHSLQSDYGNASPNGTESKFFHASDVKPSLARPQVVVKQTPSKPPTFFYANGNNIGDSPPPATQSAPAVTQQPLNDAQSKFMYANGAPELRPSPPLSRGSSSGVSGVKAKPGGRPSSGSQSGPLHGANGVQRPHSPVKFAGQSQQPLVKKQSMPMGTAARSHVTSPQPNPPKRSSMRRTSSGTSSWAGGHSRAGSLVSVEQVIHAPRFTSPQLSPHFATEPISPLHAPSTPAPLTLASIIQAAEEFDDDEDSDGGSAGDAASEDLQSPTKAAQTPDPVNELVANARRERKVQDLEITNASLEAINRTLERQLKKQSSEIRRFKRMSRNGRLSLAAAGLENAELLEGEQSTDLSLADLSEEGEELDADFEDDSFSDSDSASESLTPSIIAERDARHRKRDEKRLQLDLTKHQEMLVDSQKLNMSILRCMSWTEELIKEGQKALDYHVRVSDVKIEGRILSPPDRPGGTFDPTELNSIKLDATLAELDNIAADLDKSFQLEASAVTADTPLPQAAQ